MPAHKTDKPQLRALPEIPGIAQSFLRLEKLQSGQQQAVNELVQQYPVFYQRVLNIVNSDHFNRSDKVDDIYQAIQCHGFGHISQLVIIQTIYRTLNQYKVAGLDMQLYWQDSLRRAVSARMMGEMIGLDANRCYTAGFMQDIGFLLMFLQQPSKGLLWPEFHKREPEARYSMEQNVFNQTHDVQLDDFLESWKILPELKAPLIHHHNCDKAGLAILDGQLCSVLNCADWMSAVYTADDKSYVLNRFRKILAEDFEMEPYRAESLLESIPDEVDLSSLILDMPVGEHIVFSQILYQANIRLNEDNVNFQELTQRLENALDERDRLAAEINRDLNLAREIQQSLLPAFRDDNYPVNGINISAKILSGDFYDYFELENGDIYFNLGDVSGKGVNAALLMAKTSSLFRCLGKRISEPGKLLYEVNNELCETSVHGMFVTMVAGLYRPATGDIKLVNAGNPPALLFTEDGLCREFEATAPPLGVLQGTLYTEYTFNLHKGSLYIYSDGVTEGYIDENSMLELSGLFKLISIMDKKQPAQTRLKNIVEQFTKNSQPLRDDVTLLLIENITA